MTTNAQPRRCTERELARFGVTLSNPNGVQLTCDACGQSWSPILRAGGRMPRGYWRCPNGCNAPE